MAALSRPSNSPPAIVGWFPVGQLLASGLRKRTFSPNRLTFRFAPLLAIYRRSGQTLKPDVTFDEAR